ncbi:sugar ABC transporter substrate-binding protein [Microbacterium capsulatum]|uniref:Sugar ABC transporter substrate-binding protein n=1 Tax=Microbacterium capsulatum TaxID=3041921 RepID=A0ABU0XM78_9MICO|nr:sugar ABC transporter substrate-binding protein [Microbacterium sp. ASV81]MDQ4215190.1 sugar ABC transporter substrate-binding protein [Microbacterium sp. ASV81]
MIPTFRSDTGRRGRGRLVRLAGAAASVAVLGVLAACSSGPSAAAPSATAVPTVDPNQTYNITYWSWTKASQQAVDAFNAAHPRIHVTFEQIPSGSAGGYAKISDAFKAGNGPDVFNAEYPNLPGFVAAGQVADISGYIDPKLKAKYVPQAWDLTTLGGKTWAVPYDLGVQVMYYRTDLFKKYGLSVPKTWDEYRATAQKLKAAAPDTYLTNYTVDSGAALAAFSWQAGAQWFSTSGDTWKVNFTDSASKKVASYWQGMIDDGLVDKVSGAAQGYNADLASGKIITQLSASWQAAYIPGTLPDQSGLWAAAPMPSFDGKPASGMLGGSSYAIAKSSKNIAADVEFAQWMTSQTAAIQPRVQGGGSSAFLSNSNAASVAKSNFTSTYYPSQNPYEVFPAVAKGLKPWTWGPTMTGTNVAMANAAQGLGANATVLQVLQAGQKDAMDEMKSMGLSAKAG